MQKCARCGHRVCSPTDKIAITKIWHKCCFSCYYCNRPLNKQTAKVFCGEIFCTCCLPIYQPHRIISLPSCEFQPLLTQCKRQKTPPTPPTIILQSTDGSSARLVHSCSCVPNCCCNNIKEKIINNKNENNCKKYKKQNFHSKNKTCKCCKQFEQHHPKNNPNMNFRRFSIKIPKCIRCGDKVYAAEKIMTSVGAFHTYCFTCCCCYKALCLKTMFEAGGEIYCKQCYNSYIGTNFYGYR